MISVIVPTFNGGRLLIVQLQAILAQAGGRDVEVVVVDDGSTDDTRTLLDALVSDDRRVRVVTTGGRLGVSGARNVGVRAAASERLLFTDHDDLVGDGWLAAMKRGFDDGADFLSGTLEYDRLNAHLDGVTHRPMEVGPMETGWLPFAAGSACGMSRAAFDAVGGWDEDFPFGADDLAMSWRLQLAGFKIKPVPEAIVHIRLRPGLKALASQRYRYGLSGAILYRRFRADGMPRPLGSVLKLAARVLVVSPTCAVNPARRRWFVRNASWLTGLVVGSLRDRTRWVSGR
jgi:glycosyltransferase involved in cell wall biosynthesis